MWYVSGVTYDKNHILACQVHSVMHDWQINLISTVYWSWVPIDDSSSFEMNVSYLESQLIYGLSLHALQ